MIKQRKTGTFLSTGLVGEGGFEPPKALPADLQSVPVGHSGIPPYSVALSFSQIEAPRSGSDLKTERCELRLTWSWWTDSNPRPADYKSAALPTELHQHLQGQQPSSSRSAIIAKIPPFVNRYFFSK